MNIEQLVPPLKLCNQIPEGKFGDSLLVHAERFRNGFCLDCAKVIMFRAEAEESDSHRIIAPAPTLAEILEEIDPSFDANITVTYHFGQWKVEHRHYPREGVGSDNANPATAALKLWMEVNKGECK